MKKKKNLKDILISLLCSIIIVIGLSFFPQNNSAQLNLKLSTIDQLLYYEEISNMLVMDFEKTDFHAEFKEHLISSRKKNENYCRAIYINKAPVIDSVTNIKTQRRLIYFNLDLKLLVEPDLNNINKCAEELIKTSETILKNSLLNRINHNNETISTFNNEKYKFYEYEINNYKKNIIIENIFLEIVSQYSNLLMIKEFKTELKKLNYYLVFLFSFFSLMIIFNLKKIFFIYKKIF